jgi:hypothetical protein
MKITQLQFLRAMEAIAEYQDMVAEIDLLVGGDARTGALAEPLLDELVQQLRERCDDPAVDDDGNTSLDIYLYEDRASLRWPDGGLRLLTSPGELWDWWEASAVGPFKEDGP